MTYEMPELRLVGAASTVVLGAVNKSQTGGVYVLEDDDYSTVEIEKEW